MKCTKCGTTIDNDTKFCSVCGTKVETKPTEINKTAQEVGENKPAAFVMPVVSKGKISDKIKELLNDKMVRIALLVFAGFIVALILFLVLTYKSPKQIFDRTIDDAFKTFNNSMNVDSKQIKGKYDIKVKTENLGNIDKIAEKLELNFDYGIDYDKKLLNLNLKPTYDRDAIIDASVNFQDEKVYASLNGVFNKFIQLPIDKKEYNELFDVIKNGSSDNNEVIVKEYQKEFKKALSKKYFSKDNKAITIDDKSVKVKVSTLTISNDEFNDINNEIVNNLKDNDKFIKAYTKFTNLNESEVKKQLDKMASASITDDAKLKIDIYTKGLFNTFKGMSISIEVDGTIIGVNMYKVDSENYEYNVTTSGMTIATGTVNIVEKNNKVAATISMKIGTGTVKLIIGADISKDVSITSPNVNKAVKYDTLTITEQENIQNKIMNSKGLQSLIEDITSTTYGY